MSNLCSPNHPTCLSPNFTLAQLTVTSRRNVNNHPSSPVIIANLRQVAWNILEPVLANFKSKVVVHSGYRSPALNSMLRGASKTSQHCKGEAVDFHVQGYTNYEVACWIKDNLLNYDQLILEEFLPKIPTSGWVHCSYSPTMRNKINTKFKGSSFYEEGLLLTPTSQKAPQ